MELSATCSDLAEPANTATVSTTVQIDMTAPTLGSCPVAGPFVVGSGDQVLGPVEATDALSGIDAATSVLSGTVPTSSVGSQTVLFSAVDLAGNTSERSCEYDVVYGFDGFFSPVKADGTLQAKAGRSVPLKFTVADANGVAVSDLASVSVQVAEVDCATGEVEPAEPLATAGSSGLQHDGDGLYQLNVKTKKQWADSCRSLILDLGDGVEHSAALTLR